MPYSYFAAYWSINAALKKLVAQLFELQAELAAVFMEHNFYLEQ